MFGRSNLNKYSAHRAIHFLSGFFLGLLFLFFPRNSKRVIFNSTHNTSYNFNTKYLFEYFLKNGHEWECWFVINDEEKRLKLIKEYGDHFISSQGIKNKIFCLSARTWVTSSMETPIGGVLLSIRRNVWNLSHGVPIKLAGVGERSVPFYKKLYYFLNRTNFSGYLATSETTAGFMQKVYGCGRDKIFLCSQPRLQPIVSSLGKEAPNSGKTLKILYAPTWRQMGETLLFPFNDFDLPKLQGFLKGNNIEILLRLHPFYENSEYAKKFIGPQIRMLSSKDAPEVMDVLGEMDGVITDYSSIYVDFLPLNRPVFFIPYDYAEYIKQVGFVRDYESLAPGPRINSLSDLTQALGQMRNNEDPYRNERMRLNMELNGAISDPCAECYNFVVGNI